MSTDAYPACVLPSILAKYSSTKVTISTFPLPPKKHDTDISLLKLLKRKIIPRNKHTFALKYDHSAAR